MAAVPLLATAAMLVFARPAREITGSEETSPSADRFQDIASIGLPAVVVLGVVALLLLSASSRVRPAGRAGAPRPSPG